MYRDTEFSFEKLKTPSQTVYIEEDNSSEIGFEEIERMLESKFVKPGHTAFRILEDGEIITPVHSSITNLMNSKKLKLSDSYSFGRDAVEEYVKESSDGKKQLYILHYNCHGYHITAKDKVTCRKLEFDTVMFVLSPTIEVFNEVDIFGSKDSKGLEPSFEDVKDWIKEHKKNTYIDTIAKLADEAARIKLTAEMYII